MGNLIEGQTVVQRLAAAMLQLGQASQRYQTHMQACATADQLATDSAPICRAYVDALRVAGAMSLEYADYLERAFINAGVEVRTVN
jgi:hypothetical protein